MHRLPDWAECNGARYRPVHRPRPDQDPACYDAFPSLSNSQIEKQADWYAKTQKFQRAVVSGEGGLKDKVNAFLSDLAKPFDHVRSAAAIDTEVAKLPQFTDVPERLGVRKKAA